MLLTISKCFPENYTLVQLFGSLVMAISFELPFSRLTIPSCQTELTPLTSANCHTPHGALLPSNVHYKK